MKTCDYIQGGPQNCPYFSLAITFAKIKKPSIFLSTVAEVYGILLVETTLDTLREEILADLAEFNLADAERL